MIQTFERHRWLLTLCVLAAAALLLPAAAPADWLVTQDGARIETRGPWKVKGKQVVFTLPNGTLSALRLSEVNLEASEALTAEATKPPESEQDTEEVASNKRRPSVAVFNNKNVGRAQPAAPEEEEVEAEDEEPEEDVEGSKVEVVSWSERDSDSGDGLELVGTVRNNGNQLAANISVKVMVVNEDGENLVDTTAFLRLKALAPGRSTTFRALLPGIYTLFNEPKFEVTAGDFEITTVRPDATDAAEADSDGVGLGGPEGR